MIRHHSFTVSREVIGIVRKIFKIMLKYYNNQQMGKYKLL